MAALPVDTTSRLKLFYTGPYGSHTMTIHGGIDSTEDDLVANTPAMLNEFANWQYDGTVWTAAQFAPAGQNFFNDVTDWAPFTVDNAIGTASTDVPSRFINLAGRSPSTARRTKLYLFEVATNGDNNMRGLPGENVNIAALIDAFNGEDIQLCAIDGTPVIWKSYINYGQNDYLTHRARRS